MNFQILLSGIVPFNAYTAIFIMFTDTCSKDLRMVEYRFSDQVFTWRDGRVVEGGGLENRITSNRDGGSNPSPSVLYLGHEKSGKLNSPVFIANSV